MQLVERQAETARVVAAWRELRRVAATGTLRHRFRNTSAGVLELAQADALALLVGRGALRMTDLACALHVDTSTATRAAQRLVESGLAARHPDPHDRRAVILEVTPQGQSIYDELVANSRGAMAELLSGFDDDDLRSLANLMERFVGAIDAMGEIAPEIDL